MATINATHIALMGYHLPPMVELACRFDVDSQEDGREYAGVTMEKNQFLCDATDELGLIFFPHDSTDKDDPESVAEYNLEQLQHTLDDNSKRYFTLTEDTAFSEPGQKRYLIKSNAVMLHDPALPTQIIIETKAKVRAKTGETSSYTDLTGKVVLKPGYIFLKLWVVGGGDRNTSEACCYACMAPQAANALTDFPLMLKVETSGSASLTIAGNDRVTTSDRGIASWVLRYSGLTWETYAGALFHVRCGVPVGNDPPVKGTEMSIDVMKNVTQLVETCYDEQDSKALDLNTTKFTSNCLDYLYPDDMSGPFTNLRSWISTEWDDYICGILSSRIFEWLALRRFGNSNNADPDPRQCMNGIEINEYSMWHVGPISHHFAGFHLSGTAPLDSPRFIDPWWYQRWRDPKQRSLSGLYTKNSERYLMVKSMILITIITIPLIKMAAAYSAYAAILHFKAVVTAVTAATGGITALDFAFGDVFEYGPLTNDFNAANGQYARYFPDWLTRAVTRLQANSANVPAVDHVTNW